jgi:hypothetical protein
MSWQPIETAPKNGTVILVYRNLDGRQQMGTAYWGAPFSASGWITKGTAGNTDMGLLAPTHWMPLPAPPPSLT